MFPRDPDKMFIPGTTKEIVDKQKEVFAGLIPNFEKIFESRISDIDCFIPTQVAKCKKLCCRDRDRCRCIPEKDGKYH